MIRLFAAALVFGASTVVAQQAGDDMPPPPLVSADQPQYPQPPPTPAPEQPAQQYQQDQQQYQQPQYQQPQYQQPQQYQQQPQYEPDEQPERTYIPTQRAQRRPRADPSLGVHFTALLTGSAGIFSDAAGFTAGVRAELDVNRFALSATYNRFLSGDFVMGDVQQVTALAGWSLVAGDAGRLRLLGGLDVVGTPNTLGFAPMFGVNARLGLGTLGFEGSALLTPWPFREFDARAALVLKASIFELHGGWHYQVIDPVDAAVGGSFTTTFVSAPAVNGPYVAVGLSL